MDCVFPDRPQDYVDYTLNILGIRVWKDRCQLIGRNGNKWLPLGAAKSLPLAPADEIFVTARRFKANHPESDILEVLSAKAPPAGAVRRRAPSSSEQPPAMAE